MLFLLLTRATFLFYLLLLVPTRCSHRIFIIYIQGQKNTCTLGEHHTNRVHRFGFMLYYLYSWQGIISGCINFSLLRALKAIAVKLRIAKSTIIFFFASLEIPTKSSQPFV